MPNIIYVAQKRIRKKRGYYDIGYDKGVDTLAYKIIPVKKDKTTEYDLMISVRQLEPNSTYDFIIGRMANDTETDEFVEIFKNINQGNATNATEIIDKINKRKTERGDLTTFYSNKPGSWKQADLDIFISKFKQLSLRGRSARKLWDSIVYLEAQNKTLIQSISNGINSFTCNPGNHMETKFWKQLIYGLDSMSIDSNLIKKYKLYICCSQPCFTLYIKSNCKLDTCALFNMFNAQFRPTFNTLRTNKKQIASILNSLREAIKEDSFYASGEWISFSTKVFSVKTKRDYKITPDFGYVYYGLSKDFYGLMPYAGLQFDFRQLDKDIPFWSVRSNNILRFLSFSTGITISSIAREGQTSDFFQKTSLITGFGIRLSNSLRLTGGALWFNKKGTNPLMDSNSLAVTPYVGLSLDLSLKALFTDLSSLIPSFKK